MRDPIMFMVVRLLFILRPLMLVFASQFICSFGEFSILCMWHQYRWTPTFIDSFLPGLFSITNSAWVSLRFLSWDISKLWRVIRLLVMQTRTTGCFIWAMEVYWLDYGRLVFKQALEEKSGFGSMASGSHPMVYTCWMLRRKCSTAFRGGLSGLMWS